MSDDYQHYDNPLTTRYASREMSHLWSPQRKFSTWRRLWVALAEAEAELGLPVSQEQIAELRAHLNDFDFHGAAHHPPRRHQLLRDRQHRPDPAPRVAPSGPRPARGGGRPPGNVRPAI